MSRKIAYHKVQGAGNISPHSFRESFRAWPSDEFDVVSAQSGDIIVADGNAAGCSYLVISKNPLAAGETRIASVAKFRMPLEVAFGVHRSQAITGSEFAISVVDDAEGPELEEIPIATMSQVTTTLTVTTATPHGLTPGRTVGIYGCTDSRMNHQALAVATVTGPTTFTTNSGPFGTIASLTVGPLTSGVVFFRRRLSGGSQGTSCIFEINSQTSASFVAGEELNNQPSGTIAGSHTVAISTAASSQAVTSPYSYAFQAQNEIRLSLQPDKLQWYGGAIDSVTALANYFNRNQVLSEDVDYRIVFNAVNQKSLPMPVGKIVSATKAGSTTATIVFEAAHGLTTSDQIVIYGIRDQTNFANLTTATTVASIVSPTSITIAFGASATATSYGGYVTRANAAAPQPGAITQAISSATLTNGVLVLVGSATFSGLVVGDYVNVHGCRIDSTGVDRGIDGAWKVVDTTTNLTLTALPGTTVPPDFTISNCGGGIIKRTDLRLSFVRLTDYDRDRVELVTRPSGDTSAAVPVLGSVSVSAVPSTTPVSGNTAVDSGMPNPVAMGGRASNANISAMSASGDLVGLLMTMIGAGIFKPYCLSEAEWSFTASLTTTSDVNVQTAPGAGLKRHITHAWATNTGGAAVDVILKDGTTERIRITVPAGGFVPIPFPTGMVIAANAILNVALSAAGTVRFSAIGYTAP